MRYILFCLFVFFGIPCFSGQEVPKWPCMSTMPSHLSDTPQAYTQIRIFFDGREMSMKEYEDEFINKYEYVPGTKKFKVIRCTHEKNLIEKGKHKRHGHGSRNEIHRNNWRRHVQWFRCRICGKVMRGCREASIHYEDTGHRLFDKTEL